MPNFKLLDHAYDVALVAPGWSLTKEQCDLLVRSKIKTVAIGDVYKLLPSPSILYHADDRWWDHHKDKVKDLKCSKVSMSTFDNTKKIKTSEHLGVDYLLNSPHLHGFDMTPGWVVQSSSSGYQAFNLALHYHPFRVYLVGFDLCVNPQDQTSHFDGNHPKPIYSKTPFDMFITSMESTIPYLSDLRITVYNCNQNSAMKAFPQMDLKECLSKIGYV